MIQGIMRDRYFLAQKAEPATPADLQVRLKTFTGWTAQIIQHEIDHCKGIII